MHYYNPLPLTLGADACALQQTTTRERVRYAKPCLDLEPRCETADLSRVGSTALGSSPSSSPSAPITTGLLEVDELEGTVDGVPGESGMGQKGQLVHKG